MSKVQMLRAFVSQRLSSAVEEIFVLFERTITEYEDEVSRSKEENERQRKLLEAVWSPEVHLERADVQQVMVQQEWSFSVKQEDPESPHIKKAEEELWSLQEGEQLQGLEEAEATKSSFIPVPAKSESDEEEAGPCQRSQTEENREMEPPACNSTDHIQLQSDGEDCGGPEPAQNRDPKDKDSESSELETNESDDWSLETLKSKGDDENKPFFCATCKSIFHDECELRSHMGEKPFMCSVCGKGFTSNHQLTHHMRVHSGERSYRCTVCGKGFPQKNQFICHMRVHSGERPYKCPVCHKGFTQKPHVNVHTRVHSGEKPFRCSVCGKGFSNKHHLTDHMRVHSGERPFRCTDCDKGFTNKHHLTHHMRVHSGEKPFICTVCGKGFTKKYNLTIHMKVHTQ
ncbi:uncharacterized protein LOC143011507 [Genypterus blacodes]|uniref:uncharacterized protein LOC143011507 n=1 Tax=Genypterus blacodes TaxID=154954 RepID=UPI003F758B70